jgi:hypothetical protein
MGLQEGIPLPSDPLKANTRDRGTKIEIYWLIARPKEERPEAGIGPWAFTYSEGPFQINSEISRD